MKAKNNTITKLAITALMAALIMSTTITIRIPIPATGGYVNLGDSAIYIAAYLLGGPLGGIAAAIGSSLADLSGGYVNFALPTFVIKGIMGLVTGLICKRTHSISKYLIASTVGGAIMVLGYFLSLVIVSSTKTAIAGLLGDSIQYLAGVIAAIVLFPAAKRISAELDKKI